MKIISEESKVKLSEFLRTSSKVALILAALIIGALLHDIYLRITSPRIQETPLKFKNLKTIEETSIAINERGELMIIDRKTGVYQLYQDSVGKTIFNMYAGRIYTSKNNQ